MSYRDLRNLTEMLRSLGFPRLISMENFRTPNFHLVAEILSWLAKRYDPNADLPTDIDTEQDRIMFIRSAAQFMALKAHQKLNTKKLYQADGYAVKELLKVITVLYDATKVNIDIDDDTSMDVESISHNYDISSKLTDIATTRQLASEITSKGAALYDLLGKETELREIRSNVIAKQLEISEVELGLKTAIAAIEEDIQKTNNMIENVASDEANLEAKIEKKKSELERNQKRLQTLKKVRPAFMDEFEKLEEELKKCYETYVFKYRCLTYLEQLLDEHDKVEQEKIEERQFWMRKMVEQMKREELLNTDESGNLDGGVDKDDDNNVKDEHGAPNRRPHNTGGIRPGTIGKEPATRKMFGSMTGATEDESGDSLESDSDLDLEGEGADDGVSDFGSEDELQLNADIAGGPTRKSMSKSSALIDSDNDF